MMIRMIVRGWWSILPLAAVTAAFQPAWFGFGGTSNNNKNNPFAGFQKPNWLFTDYDSYSRSITPTAEIRRPPSQQIIKTDGDGEDPNGVRPSQRVRSSQARSISETTALTTIGNLMDQFPFMVSNKLTSTPSSSMIKRKRIKHNHHTEMISSVAEFLGAYNEGDVDTLLAHISPKCVWDDYNFYKPVTGKEAIERRLRLQLDCSGDTPLQRMLIVDDRAVSDDSKVGIRFHLERLNGNAIPNSRGCAYFTLDGYTHHITRVDWVTESAIKPGEGGLRLLAAANKFMEITGWKSEDKKQEKPLDKEVRSSAKRSNSMLPLLLTSPELAMTGNTKPNTYNGGLSAPVQYYKAWNERNMDAAMSVFSNAVTYDDTAFPKPFQGKSLLRKHLDLCAAALPESFRFQMDHLIDAGERCMARWHLESEGQQLPFTRGLSFYKVDGKGQITDGMDFVEPGPIKLGPLTLLLETVKNRIMEDPKRLIPLLTWMVYMYVVFFSDGILPGANALQFEGRTWEEVRDLSLNFFLVAPLMDLPFSPSVHPMMEGVFNLLLSWAALFAGFLSDERRDKPNVLPIVPTVVGMQFLTSAFLLPYLATRNSERSTDVTREQLPAAAKWIGENRLLGPALASVGAGSIAWGFMGRVAEFGAEFGERFSSFMDLLSIDRVGSSFLVDLVIFAAFQSWFVDDDLKRRGATAEQYPFLTWVGKNVPFFGMATYMTLRPGFRSRENYTSRRKE